MNLKILFSRYKQTFSDNMTIISPPIIKKITKKPYTIITFTPDYSRFNNNGLSQDMYNVMCKRVYDLCALTDPSVSVYINDEKILIKNEEGDSKICLEK